MKRILYRSSCPEGRSDTAGPCWLWQAAWNTGVRRRVGSAGVICGAGGEGTDDQRIPCPLIWMNFTVNKELSRTFLTVLPPRPRRQWEKLVQLLQWLGHLGTKAVALAQGHFCSSHR